MTTEHDDVRNLLAAWAFGALDPTERHTVPQHLAECEACATEAERLHETVRLLDNPALAPTPAPEPPPGSAPVPAPDPAPGPGPERGPAPGSGPAPEPAPGSAPAPEPAPEPASGSGPAPDPGGAARRPAAGVLAEPGPAGAARRPAADILAAARRTRPASPRVAVHAVPYAAAVAGLRALLPEMVGRWSTPVVHDWDVHATVAHLLAADEHLARLVGLAPRVPPSRLPADLSWTDAWERRTADVIAHEHGRAPEETVADWAAQADGLLAVPEAHDPERAARAVELMGLRLPVADHYLGRAFETWMHTDDIGRALGLVVPPPPERHLWQLVRLAVRVLGIALGPTAPPVLLSVTGGEEWVLGAEGEPVRAELALDAYDFCLLVGGRHDPGTVPANATGDAAAVRNVLERAASLAWL
ncbi:maleylpyruvate isomerase family mycothiol-dependent enzyme [Streptomyces justiciae]|uniref:maleylpyruvate isomerase family mycothiol-dependent enzyme n=1 Tax=Streptomyces justiciae TaxID=2780140 RepID=UPI00188047EA|nr:maleylpyruvate isomerase family mycothiol-dependent enzyme [Streptomyces justiciae]MBE8473202.1 maleylpyruvate isomerase family mycothiol-dependent enzyme [Streptomyces justiciae]MCW8380365.1 maleylpyruvate isomerase family mycothiol-dependent enzyme [Streptomyces justiciae]